MTVAQVIREVSLDLNDQEPGHEYARWSVELLQIYVREALWNLAYELKERFTKTVVIPVETGDWQQACCCTEILKVLGESDADGHILRTLRRQDDIESYQWAGPYQRCVGSPKDYTMQTYSISSTDGNQFRVIPPVPVGAGDRFIAAVCFVRPTGDLNELVPEDCVVMVKLWALARALAVDSENNQTITQLADNHMKLYFSLLQAAKGQVSYGDKRGDHIRAFQDVPNQQVPRRAGV